MQATPTSAARCGRIFRRAMIFVVSVAASACLPAMGNEIVVCGSTTGAPTGLVTSTAGWLSWAFQVATTSSITRLRRGDLDAVAREAHDLHGGTGRLVVAIAKRNKQAESIVWFSDKAAALNLGVLRSTSNCCDRCDVVLSRRVEREAVRAVGGMLAMPPCPMRTCALSEHSSLAELDRKGRGLCPPCMWRAKARLKALGLRTGAFGTVKDGSSPPAQNSRRSKQKAPGRP